ncbi:MAG: FtsX-like permease family protein [Bacteroidetes bacterium]|nr:FtsX-like permease family protein [Bacteroidota bacterium]
MAQKLLEISGINNVAITNGNPLGNWKIRYELENDEYYTPNVFSGDEDLINTFGLEVIRGDYHNRKGEIVNETLVKYFNFIDPLGETLPGTKKLIIAVVKDFNIGSFKNEIPPVVISLDENDPLGKSMILDYPAGKLAGILPEIEKSWRRVYPDYPFEYRIIEDELLKAHKDDLYFLKIIVSFALICILITCFGLFSLAWAITQNRTKEIGIRKVIGATFFDIFQLLTVDFSKWILVAFILATPIAWYLMNEWLQNFSFRIKLSPVIFMAGGIIIFVIALLTVSIHAIRAARVNPVDELRNE